MERRLRIRIEHVPFTDSSIIEEIPVTTEYIENFNNSAATHFLKEIIGFRINLRIVRLSKLTDINMVLDDTQINYLTDHSDIAAIIDLEINTDYQFEFWKYPSSNTEFKYNFLLFVARSLYRKYNKITEIIRYVDYKDKSRKQLINPAQSKPGTPYRVYVNNQIITQKFYPYDISDYQQLEENVFLNLPAGTHQIRLEVLGNNNLKINGFACDDLIMTDISVNELSFQIQ